MKLQLDPNVTYALAFQGGGARGAYQIGVWRALREAKLRIGAVAGTSVGALNGVLVTMGDLERAEEIWENIRYSQVMDVDDETMQKLFAKQLRSLDLHALTEQLRTVVKNRGLDVTPLYTWMQQVVSEPVVRASETELYIVTYSLTDQRELELRAKDLPDGTIADMLLASAYLPAFRNEKLGGKRYADGGVRDALPLHVLLQNGYRDILAVKLGAMSVTRRVRIPHAAKIYTIEPTEDLGGILDFNAEHSKRIMQYGYYDALRLLYALRGTSWYFDGSWTEDDAYAFLYGRCQAALPRGVYSRRQLNEKVLPTLAKKLNAPKKDYMELAYALLEAMAERAGLTRWHVYTEAAMLEALKDNFDSIAFLRELLPANQLLPSPSILRHLPQPEEAEGLNVCLMNDSFPPTIDGVANTVKNYAQEITESYGRCTVVTPEYPDVHDAYPFPVVRYPSINTVKLAGYRTGNPLAPDTIAKLSQSGFNIIHSHCPAVSCMLARSLREVVNAPVVFTYHTKFDIDIARAVKSELLQNTAVKLLVNNISACDDVWVVSSGAGDNLRKLGYTGNFTVMPNGVDLPRGRVCEAALQALNTHWHLPSDAPVYLFVGRMMWYKGLRLTLDALAELRAAGKRFCMVFVGDGADKKEIVAYAQELGLADCCRFVGAVQERETIRAWYCRSDLLLFPSTFDTNGLVVREAAACELGSVLVRGSCAAEGITDGRTGILIDESSDALCQALLRVSGDAAKQIGQTAADEIYLSWHDSVGAACARYESLIEAWKRGELRKPRAPLDSLFDRSGDMLQTLGLAKQQTQKAFAQLTKEFNRVRGKRERYL